jgi:hypothetical protein
MIEEHPAGGTSTLQPRPLIERYDAALVDLDGVVYLVEHAIAGAAETIRRVGAAGMRLVFVTNNAFCSDRASHRGKQPQLSRRAPPAGLGPSIGSHPAAAGITMPVRTEWQLVHRRSYAGRPRVLTGGVTLQHRHRYGTQRHQQQDRHPFDVREADDDARNHRPARPIRLVLGHESLGRVMQAPAGSDFSTGDLVVGVVRRPDPVPCGACAHDEWDICRNGRYTERGIKGLDGYGSQRWTVPKKYAVRVDSHLGHAGVLLEPTSVVAKAWEQVDRIGARAWFEPERLLVTGAGPIGLLAAMIGVQRGMDVHVLDRVATDPSRN